jgi:holo-[acyl-carrier protein] synthase
MIIGIGFDLCDVRRLQRALERPGFRERVFAEGEIRDCDRRARRQVHYAARFAAKEAFFKAIGTGWGRGVGWREVAVDRRPDGPPRLRIAGAAARRAETLGVRRTHLSITHDGDYAAAVVVLEGTPGRPARSAAVASGRRARRPAAGGTRRP